MIDKTHYLTKARYEQLKKELAESKTIKIKEVAKELAAAIEMGDLSENAAYEEAKNKQAFLQGRILELEDIINNVVFINGNHNSNKVEVGSKIIVECEEIGKKEYTIVGPAEADPIKGLISNQSPLGEAFLGKEVKEEVEIVIPKGVTKCKILKII